MTLNGLFRTPSKGSPQFDPSLALRCSAPTEPILPPVCPSCSAGMTGRKCKLICERCGYFESCADLI